MCDSCSASGDGYLSFSLTLSPSICLLPAEKDGKVHLPPGGAPARHYGAAGEKITDFFWLIFFFFFLPKLKKDVLSDSISSKGLVHRGAGVSTNSLGLRLPECDGPLTCPQCSCLSPVDCCHSLQSEPKEKKQRLRENDALFIIFSKKFGADK